ncbi:MAG TPA: GlmU family protein [Chitinophagaceae bacterium]|nr:GlmU family protein [Chitinophagaceae bacterium]
MNFILFDDERYFSFLPLTHTRPVADLRCGFFTMQERWHHLLLSPPSFLSQPHLSEKFPLITGNDNILINSGLFPSAPLMEAIVQLKKNTYLIQNHVLLAARCSEEQTMAFDISTIQSSGNAIEFNGPVQFLNHPWDLFQLNGMAIEYDVHLLTNGRTSAPVSDTNTVLGHRLFIEEGARVEASVINTLSGPVYIARGAEIMEGCMIRGPLGLGKDSVLKMGAKVYGATTLGPGCKAGGELNNVVFQANSNKAHDGFLGNSVIGEWCNLGADTNNSNLKNNYEEVKLWNEKKKSFIKTGLQFCGLIMGDHSKCGINTMFNTGTVVGVSCNVYGAGFPRNFIPSFSWGSANGFMEYQLSKAVETATRVFERRNIRFDAIEQNLMAAVYELTREQRNY